MSQHIKEIAKVLISRGFTPVAAAGIIGNAGQESGLNPASVGDGGGGLWGFTSGAISLASLQGYAKAKGESWTDAKVQANFLADHVDSGTKATLNSIKSPTAAAQYFMENWERPYVPTENLARRQQTAQLAYHQISGLNPATAKSIAQGRAGTTSTSTKSTAPSSTSTTTSAPQSEGMAILQNLMSQYAPAAAGPSTSIPTLTPVKIS